MPSSSLVPANPSTAATALTRFAMPAESLYSPLSSAAKATTLADDERNTLLSTLLDGMLILPLSLSFAPLFLISSKLMPNALSIASVTRLTSISMSSARLASSFMLSPLR